MPLRNIQPLEVLWQDGLNENTLDGVFSGIAYILWLANVAWVEEADQEFQVKRLGQRRQPSWKKPSGLLTAEQSLDWHIACARLGNDASVLNSTALLDSLHTAVDHVARPTYELVVVSEPIFRKGNPKREIAGAARLQHGAVMTVANHLQFLQPKPEETPKDKKNRESLFCLVTQMVTMHELGHVFGLFPGTHIEDPTEQERKESHCLNSCVMWYKEDHNLYKKIRHNPFCYPCLAKLKQFFLTP